MRTPEETEKHNRFVNESAMKDCDEKHVIIPETPEAIAELRRRSEYLEDYWKNLNNGSEM